jgi:CHAT domain-containing protein
MSACGTAAIGEDLPDEPLSLAAAVLHAGAAGVVGSLWSVADVSTMLLMARFHELRRAAATDPARALRDAQVWLRDSTNERLRRQLAVAAELPVPAIRPPAAAFWASARPYSHPFHWAAFSYTGV